MSLLGVVFGYLINDLASRANPNVIFYQEFIENPGVNIIDNQPLILPRDGFLIAYNYAYVDSSDNVIEDKPPMSSLLWTVDKGSVEVDFVRCDNKTLDRYGI